MRAEMASAGVGDAATRKTLVLLQSILERAVEWRVSTPTRRGGPQAEPAPHPRRAPAAAADDRDHARAPLVSSRSSTQRSISVLAYAGLRPGEALGLRWHDIGERTLLVERSVAFGQLKSTKTGQTRTVRLIAPLAETSCVWRKATTRSTPTDLVFPSPDGSPWNDDRGATGATAFRRCRRGRRHSRRSAYDLRHSFVSLLIAQGATVVEVAAQAGHAPTMTLDTYAHLFDELRAETTHLRRGPDPRRAPRQRPPEVSVLCPRDDDPNSTDGQKMPGNQQKADARTRTGNHFIIREAPGVAQQSTQSRQIILRTSVFRGWRVASGSMGILEPDAPYMHPRSASVLPPSPESRLNLHGGAIGSA